MKKTTSVIAAVLTFAVLVPDFSQPVNAFETENTKTVSVTSNDENSRISESLKKIMAESPLIPETCTPNAVYGDVDTDGVIDLSDLTMISHYMLMDIELNEQQKRNADVNADGEIAVNDMALLKQYILREDVKFGAEKKNTDSTEIKYKDSVKWLGFSYQTDIHDDYINGDSGSVTLVNISERDEYIEKTAGYPGVADFAAEYDEEFFENNVLILKLIYQPQGYGAAFRIDSVGYSSDENILTVDYSHSDIFSQGPAPASVSYVIAAVEVPSEYYHADSVVWRLSGKV